MALNKIIVMGRICNEVELRRTSNGTAVASFTIACDRDFGDKETDFIECVAWQKTAEFVQKYFGKGRMIIVSGRLQIRGWTDKDGNKRKTAEVVADNVYFGDSKKEESSGFAPESAVASEFAMLTDEDSQLPF
jgi:single-strand DNA-binding protein